MKSKPIQPRLFCLLLLGLIFLRAPLWGQQGDDSVPSPANTALSEDQIPLNFGAPAAKSPDYARSDWAQVFVFLLLVIAAIWLLLRFLRRLSFGGDREGQLFELLASRQLPGIGFLHLVLIDDRLYFIGGQNGRLQLLDTIDDAEKRDRLRLLARQTPTSKKFSSLLPKLRKST